MRAQRRIAALAAAGLLWVAPARAAETIAPGSYCRLPEPGEEPECLEPSRRQYPGFFERLGSGEPSDADVAAVEADVAGGERAYLALSSLAYGYHQLAQRAARSPGEDPSIVARLERWNALLASAYASTHDEQYRAAIRSAAEDVRDRSAALELSCVDASGSSVPCRTTESVLRGIDQAGGEVGVRGALSRLLRRVFGSEAP